MIELHPRNAAGMWRSLAGSTSGGGVLADEPDLIAARPTPHSPVRAIVLRPGMDPRELADRMTKVRPPGVLTVLEDPFGTVGLASYGYVVRRGGRMAVMVRRAGPPPEPRNTGITVSVAGDEPELATVERVIVEGFPVSSALPWVQGRTLPAEVLSLPGWRVYLARAGGAAVGAGYTWDDPEAAGVYWLATLPSHRGRGVARALLSRMLADLPDVPMTLTASVLGEPLYVSVGFTTVSPSVWWIPEGEAAVWASMTAAFA